MTVDKNGWEPPGPRPLGRIIKWECHFVPNAHAALEKCLNGVVLQMLMCCLSDLCGYNQIR